MKFDAAFLVPATPDEAIRLFTDVERMAGCFPGAALNGRDDDGNWSGTLAVAFGPKNIQFRGKAIFEFDLPARTCIVLGRGEANMRAARFQVRTMVTVTEDAGSRPDAPLSRVELNSEAELSGVLSAFAGPGGEHVGKGLIDQFAENLAREYGGDEEAEQSASTPPVPDAISAGSVLKSALGRYLETAAWLAPVRKIWRIFAPSQ